MSGYPDQTQFALHVGESFRLRLDGGRTLDLDLVEATAGQARPARPGSNVRSEPFSLVFRSRGPAPLPQKIYRLEHARLGAMDVFLVPLGPDATGMRFEAVFN